MSDDRKPRTSGRGAVMEQLKPFGLALWICGCFVYAFMQFVPMREYVEMRPAPPPFIMTTLSDDRIEVASTTGAVMTGCMVVTPTVSSSTQYWTPTTW
jgi:hypothetical protein